MRFWVLSFCFRFKSIIRNSKLARMYSWHVFQEEVNQCVLYASPTSNFVTLPNLCCRGKIIRGKTFFNWDTCRLFKKGSVPFKWEVSFLRFRDQWRVSDYHVWLLYTRGFRFSCDFKSFRSFKKCSDGPRTLPLTRVSGKRNHRNHRYLIALSGSPNRVVGFMIGV